MIGVEYWKRSERRGLFKVWARGGMPGYAPTWADFALLEEAIA